MRLEGEIAVVSGGGSGIGLEVCRRFASEGAAVAALDRHVSENERCLSLVCDLADDFAVSNAKNVIVREIGNPTIVIHAAGIGVLGTSAGTATADYANVHNVNVGGAVRLLNSFSPAMQAARHGAFVFVSSINADFGTPGLAAYASSKAALDSVMRTAALELAPDGVRVNSVRPASIDTPMLRAGFARAEDPEKARMLNVARHPLGRLGTAEDVANLVLFLASREAAWITGATYAIDGGAAVARR